MATWLCGVIALAGLVGETICRLSNAPGPGNLSTLAGVAVGALAGAVPSWLINRNGNGHKPARQKPQ